MARLAADGKVDTTFGRGGVVVWAPPGSRVREPDEYGTPGIRRLRLLPDGSVVALGTGFDGTTSHAVVARFTRRGRLDPRLGGTGFRRLWNSESTGEAIVELDRRRTLLVSPLSVRRAGLQWLIDGRRVTRAATVATPGRVESATAGPRGGIDLSGSDGHAFVVRLDRDGRPLPTFGTGGYQCDFTVDYGAYDVEALTLADGRIFTTWVTREGFDGFDFKGRPRSLDCLLFHEAGKPHGGTEAITVASRRTGVAQLEFPKYRKGDRVRYANLGIARPGLNLFHWDRRLNNGDAKPVRPILKPGRPPSIVIRGARGRIVARYRASFF